MFPWRTAMKRNRSSRDSSAESSGVIGAIERYLKSVSVGWRPGDTISAAYMRGALWLKRSAKNSPFKRRAPIQLAKFA